MNDTSAALLITAVLFSLMAFRAFRSGTAADYVLGGTQCLGLLLLLSDYQTLACYLLLLTAAAYLLSQIPTGARVPSRLLPVAGAMAVGFLLLG